ncbi:UNVERIFIED_CONTAM: hypothetical protein Sangu_2170600 [Sesamum angustifolium]|uniref:Uncharacterized protein n=1 Tax=Sesamum angustifolium TaxID=2727405 RepID=A0AAW2LFS5_9LAMI
MGSMNTNNNWLGFSLSPQEHELPQETSSSLPTLDEISAAAQVVSAHQSNCFNHHLTTAQIPSHDSGSPLPLPSLNLPPPFSIFQPFSTSSLSTTSQD